MAAVDKVLKKHSQATGGSRSSGAHLQSEFAVTWPAVKSATYGKPNANVATGR